MDSLPQPIWGVWIPKKGWLRGKEDIYAFENEAVAKTLAEMYGSGAQAKYVDVCLFDEYTENMLIKQETKKWRIFGKS